MKYVLIALTYKFNFFTDTRDSKEQKLFDINVSLITRYGQEIY